MFRRLSLISLACLIPLGALAQRNPNFPARATPCELQIHVSYEDDHPAERLLQVELLNSNGGSSGQAFTGSAKTDSKGNQKRREETGDGQAAATALAMGIFPV